MVEKFEMVRRCDSSNSSQKSWYFVALAFQTAVALAEYEAEKDEEGKILLKDVHLSSIVEMSKEFKEYLNELHQGDEEKRATRELTRLGGYDNRNGKAN